MNKTIILGILTILLGIGMLIFVATMFSYQGSELNPLVSKLGMYSFLFWLPIILLGIGITLFGILKKSNVL
ncbi:hypothetical protein [Mucilaginibacter gracilis]|nr:hypothetical protein [Mucilaginibacter gracilis]